MSNRTKPGRKFGKGNTLFGNKGHGGDDGDDFDNGNGNGNDNDDGGDRSTTKKPIRRRDKTTGEDGYKHRRSRRRPGVRQ